MAQPVVVFKRIHDVFKRIQNAWERNNFPDMNLKPKQVKCLEVIAKNNKDLIAVLPTGYGKSLVFQVLPDFLSSNDSCTGLVIVVTAVNSIITDQVETLNAFGMSSYTLTARDDSDNTVLPSLLSTHANKETSSSSNINMIPENVELGTVRVVFCHPETILSDVGRELMEVGTFKDRVKAIVIDEAHCMDTW